MYISFHGKIKTVSGMRTERIVLPEKHPSQNVCMH